MQTPTHILVAAAIFSKRTTGEEALRNRRINWAVLVGALLPDVTIFILFAWARWVQGASEADLWERIYWMEPWQTLGAITNSFPVFAVILISAILARVLWIRTLALAGLAHIALDLPFHHDDAHRHFWPLSDWRYHSPISYWDPEHHGDIVSVIEFALVIGLIVVLWRRFPGWPVRIALCAALTTYIAVPVYFTLMLSGS